MKDLVTAESEMATPATRELYQESVASWLAPRCDELVFNCFLGIAGGVPEFLIEPVAWLLHALLTGAHGQVAKESTRRWLIGTPGGGVTEEGKHKFMAVVELQPPLSGSAFCGVVDVLAKACRNASSNSAMNGLNVYIEERERSKAGMQA